MNFKDTPEDAAFRAEVRAWLDANAKRRGPDSIDLGALTELLGEDDGSDEETVARAKAWQKTLYDAGWAGLTWPAEYGGRDLTPMQVIIFNEELAGYEIPANIFSIGQSMIGPTIMAHGTQEQKDRYLRPMLSGEEVWCQLWSEPNAGSDVASLQTRAARSGEDWVLNGQKVWTSGAHYSDFGLIIARSDPEVPKHRGITCFIVDMRAPGVDPRPLRQMTGGANFNEVFLSDVRIPDANRVGDVNDGWRVALTVLMNERLGVARAFNVQSLIDPLIDLAKRRGFDDEHVRQEVADLYVRATLLTLTGHRSTTKIVKGSIPGPEGSISKLVWSEVLSDVAAKGVELLGLAGAVVGDEAADHGVWSSTNLAAPGVHLGGGTDEIQRNIIGERVLGLPKEPR